MATTVTVDLSALEGLADRIESIGPVRLSRAALDAVNSVTRDFSEQAMKREIADINLTPAYVRSKTDLTLATNPRSPRAEIVTRGDLTVMGRYQPLVQLRSASTRSAALGPLRGRPAGVSVRLRRSAPTEQPKWFTMRLRRGKEAGTLDGVFVRGSSGVRHLYGPSPYSLFRHQVNVGSGQLQDDLTREFLARAEEAL